MQERATGMEVVKVELLLVVVEGEEQEFSQEGRGRRRRRRFEDNRWVASVFEQQVAGEVKILKNI